jgi:putative ABC transport system ATP-binding protein
MEQAVHLGDRLIMMHQGGDSRFRGAEKERLRSNDLLDRFDEVRRMDRLDESAAEMLARLYV